MKGEEDGVKVGKEKQKGRCSKNDNQKNQNKYVNEWNTQKTDKLSKRQITQKNRTTKIQKSER